MLQNFTKSLTAFFSYINQLKLVAVLLFLFCNGLIGSKLYANDTTRIFLEISERRQNVPPCTTFSDIVSIGGTVTISGSLYPSLTEAIFDLAQCGITKPVILSLNADYLSSAETFPIVIPSIPGANIANTITIKPAPGLNKTISGSSDLALIKLNGAHHIIIDGSNVVNGLTKNLTITNTDTSTSAAVIWIASTLTDGAHHNVIKNTVVSGYSGTSTAGNIVISGSVLGAAAEFPNNDITITNNSLFRAQNAIYSRGGTATLDQNLIVSKNSMGSPVESEKGFRGISVQNANAFAIENNTVAGITTATIDISSGIRVGGIATNGVVAHNKISDVKNTNVSGYGSNGLFLTSSSVASNILVYNNMIWDVAGIGYPDFYGADDNGYGMIVNNGGGYKIYYNSVNMTTDQTRGNSAAFNVTNNVTSSGAIDLRNNIFTNNQTSNTRYAIYSGVSNLVFSAINFNDYYSTENLGFLRGVRTTLAEWQTATGKDSNSLQIFPPYVSPTDLHIQGCDAPVFPATPISGIATDIDGDARSVTFPAMGADEFQQNSGITFTGFNLPNPTLWSMADNWSSNTLPSLDKCVVIPTGKNVVVNITDAAAKKLTIASGGKLTINENQTLTLEDGFVNQSEAGDFTIASDGNLIQINPSKTINSGLVTAERFITNLRNDPGRNVDYVYWSSPVHGQQTLGATGFSPGTPSNTFFSYRESDDRFYQTNDAVFIPGKGYAVRAENGLGVSYDKIYRFVGEANNGEVQSLLTRSANTGANQEIIHGFNMVGNPYPSNINLERLFEANSEIIHRSAWFWTNASYTPYQQGSSYTGNNYAVYNGTGGNAATFSSAVPSAAVLPNGIVKVGQGFMLQKKNFGTENLVFNNSYGSGQDLRVGSSGVFYYKSTVSKNRFTLQLTAPDQLVNSQLIGYIDGATDNFEEDYDSEVMALSSNLFYSTLNERRLLIQGKSMFKVQDKVSLGANFFQNGNYTIALANSEGVFANGQNIYLKDLQTGIITNLSQGSYNFAASTGEDNSRFQIIYEPATTLATTDLLDDEISIYRVANDFVIKSKIKKISRLEIFDATGRMVHQKSTSQKEVRFDSQYLSRGIYLLRIFQDGNVTTKKIIR